MAGKTKIADVTARLAKIAKRLEAYLADADDVGETQAQLEVEATKIQALIERLSGSADEARRLRDELDRTIHAFDTAIAALEAAEEALGQFE